ncbi:adhesion G protein-coupled receptor F4 [Cheilinus undulatus]|uniref:adhesion G protein-coupled receptor F4 n=1 Tax=Cheilinus undulatus TaxID=241271 RepID=UPI001BD5D148|nr:adhesion G protein-coupled receptor F4 [Cheilinus undulatus]XP_041660575.1 adhesion G protein-coupled receptor F4 [Cheilinus undulatus]
MAKTTKRETMNARMYVFFVIGALCIFYQASATDNIYIAELMVESNVTLEAQAVVTSLGSVGGIEVKDEDGALYTVTLTQNELTAECLIFGDDSSCNCSTGYTWSNEICYSHECCRDMTCNKNVSHITPLCVTKQTVRINGSVTLSGTTWEAGKTTQLTMEFEKLNAFDSLNITGQRQDNSIADFEAAVNVQVNTSKLQEVVTSLEGTLNAVILVDTEGMVTIESPSSPVCYKSSPVLQCVLEEETESSGWNITREQERLELFEGSVVKLDTSCVTEDYKSCTQVTLEEITSIWEGMYECGFTSGSIRHTAKSKLDVASLPDEIILSTNPLTTDCSKKQKVEPVVIMATIPKSTENFRVVCKYTYGCTIQSNTTDGDHQIYKFEAQINCEKQEPHFANITFKNSKDQEKSAKVDIPVIYEGSPFCEEEVLNGEFWPRTPSGDTAINRSCTEGRTGYKSRTCKDRTWEPVFFYCVNQELNNVERDADNFMKGLGATEEVAFNIFERLKNFSVTFVTDTSSISDTTADVNASINVLSLMARASETIELHEEVFDDFILAASNMLNTSWSGVNESVVHDMSSSYLESVENLVQNIKVNQSTGVQSPNLDLNFCSRPDCNVTVFDIRVTMNITYGIMKTLGIKNLMDRMTNNFKAPGNVSLILSATLENNNDTSLQIRMDFPTEQQEFGKRDCVFWNTTDREWSKVGCTAKKSHGNRTVCACTHLTSFSVLMAKGKIKDEVLDLITLVGLGVSVCSLLIFLIVESLVWSAVVKTNLSHFRHTALVNIAVFLLLANCCFLASTSPEDLSESWCFALTVGKHLFYMAMFSWMLCMSVMLVHQLIFVFSPLRKRVFMFLSSIVGYICPILIVGSSYVYCRYTGRDYFKKDTCWLVYVRLLEGSIHAFLLPVGTIILTNLFSMVVVIVTLVKSSAPEGSKAEDKETIKSILKVVVFLTPVFGVAWIIGFAQLMLNDESPLHRVALYSFTILNSFQGLFLLITGCFAEQKVREELFKLVMAKSKGKSESMKNLTSTTYTKDK